MKSLFFESSHTRDLFTRVLNITRGITSKNLVLAMRSARLRKWMRGEVSDAWKSMLIESGRKEISVKMSE